MLGVPPWGGGPPPKKKVYILEGTLPYGYLLLAHAEGGGLRLEEKK